MRLRCSDPSSLPAPVTFLAFNLHDYPPNHQSSASHIAHDHSPPYSADKMYGFQHTLGHNTYKTVESSAFRLTTDSTHLDPMHVDPVPLDDLALLSFRRLIVHITHANPVRVKRTFTSVSPSYIDHR